MPTVWAFELAARLAPLLPRRLVYALADLAGRLAYALAGPARANVEANLARVLGSAAAPRRLHEAARGVFITAARNYAGLFLPPAGSREALARADLRGWEHLEAARDSGRGVVLLTAHFGNFNFYADLFHASGIPVIALVERLRRPRLFRLVTRLRNRRGVRFVLAEGSLREAVRALRANEVVAIASDRLVVGAGEPVEFFGEPTQLPPAAVILARRCGAAVIPAFGYDDESGRTQGCLGPPLPLEGLPPGEAGLKAGMRLMARALEEPIRRHPEQWVVFQRVWK